jgi:hypothetical protein
MADEETALEIGEKVGRRLTYAELTGRVPPYEVSPEGFVLFGPLGRRWNQVR